MTEHESKFITPEAKEARLNELLEDELAALGQGCRRGAFQLIPFSKASRQRKDRINQMSSITGLDTDSIKESLTIGLSAGVAAKSEDDVKDVMRGFIEDGQLKAGVSIDQLDEEGYNHLKTVVQVSGRFAKKFVRKKVQIAQERQSQL